MVRAEVLSYHDYVKALEHLTHRYLKSDYIFRSVKESRLGVVRDAHHLVAELAEVYRVSVLPEHTASRIEDLKLTESLMGRVEVAFVEAMEASEGLETKIPELVVFALYEGWRQNLEVHLKEKRDANGISDYRLLNRCAEQLGTAMEAILEYRKDFYSKRQQSASGGIVLLVKERDVPPTVTIQMEEKLNEFWAEAIVQAGVS